MFDKLKKALLGHDKPAAAASAASGASAFAPVSEWAAAQGFSFASQGERSFSIQGKVAGRPWRMELGRPSRNYIQGEELRARAELGVDENVAVMVMSRSLKDALEKQAYDRYTDTLQTSVDHNLPEEVRWLAMFEEFGWDSPSRMFWARYAVLGAQREDAVAWVDAVLANQLLTWPNAAPEVPLVLMVLRGKAYLRMQQTPGDMQALQHAAQVFTAACESALAAFKRPG
ncbi:MAG: hypothetical protein AVDCRST_MAG51-1062 [uncultured Ramlibacter sp.]|uniref:Uncharacterized protein n=1 Tax=uncultured Ramlibacter sp. TaxID=260755 RepID=A0A6J4P248_9BURK|nr:MAG: hypothetical protein AVDCRST_MAG51-1062 [uncultured Ramlibacter sp.]